MKSSANENRVANELDDWAKGYGVIAHNSATQKAVKTFVQNLAQQYNDKDETVALNAIALLKSADRICSAGMWLVAHMTYANKVRIDGESLQPQDFKEKAQGHTGGSLNMVPAYTGYLLANSLSGKTRSWIMGQGHCVAAIEAINAITGNQYDDKAELYACTQQGLSQLCYDFYRYEQNDDGTPVSRVGSHVNVQTAGGVAEGGYLGFTELQYAHMPLPEQELVAFLSDGAFEEQRGSDWAPHWWRAEDTGLVMPIMIANRRRIDQRSTLEQLGGTEYFKHHLALNGFDPFVIDGSDPAAYALAILTMAKNLHQASENIAQGNALYPVKLPYAIAEVTKGYGMPNAGTNPAHNLPLGKNLQEDEEARANFNHASGTLFVEPDLLSSCVSTLNNHAQGGRPQEKDHPLRKFKRLQLTFPPDNFTETNESLSCMEELDQWFTSLIRCNADVRFRLGNPDELNSNRMTITLSCLKHRVTNPENDDTESVTGAVITALNEEAVMAAVLANKQGAGIVVTYEAFALKMLGAMRQEAIFARHLMLTQRKPNWLSVPVIATSHTWENGKNEQSHQDPKFAENWLAEMEDVAPVYFPIDANTTVALTKTVYQSYGRIAVLVTAKKPLPVMTTASSAKEAVQQGVITISEDENAALQLIAIGGYQLQACLEAAEKLRHLAVKCSVIAILAPGKFRIPRDEIEAEHCHTDNQLRRLVPAARYRVVVTHTGADIMTGILRRLDLGPEKTRVLGYINRGGTLDTTGMQQINNQTPEDIVSCAQAFWH